MMEHLTREYQQLTKDFKYTFAGSFLAGGAIASKFTNKPINDFDVYFKSRESFESAVKQAYSSGFWCVSLTSRAITFKKGNWAYQFMHFKFFPQPCDIFDTFDFTCCMGAIDFDAGQFVFHPRFLSDLSRRELVFNHNTAFPLASGFRVMKYIDKGFTISRKEWIKVVTAVSFKKIESWDELKNQMGGSYGDVVAMDTTKPFDLDSAMESINGAHVESATEKDVPANDEQVTESLEASSPKPMPENAAQALAEIFQATAPAPPKVYRTPYWVNGQTTVMATSELDAMKVWKQIRGYDATTVKKLPYPASPILNRAPDDCPAFCYDPSSCQGNGCCRKNPACSE